MITIPITSKTYGTKFCKIDEQDIHLFYTYKWSLHPDRNKEKFYLVTRKGKEIQRLHRLIMMPQADQFVDHIDGDPLNNSRYNLRICTNKENIRNQSINRRNTSGYKGVYWDKDRNKWRSQITVDQKRIYLGLFNNKELAYEAYCSAAIKLHGNFARF